MPKNSATFDIEKRPAKGKGGLWLLRDSKTGKFTEVRSTARSAETIEKTVSANSKLLERLAKK